MLIKVLGLLFTAQALYMGYEVTSFVVKNFAKSQNVITKPLAASMPGIKTNLNALFESIQTLNPLGATSLSVDRQGRVKKSSKSPSTSPSKTVSSTRDRKGRKTNKDSDNNIVFYEEDDEDLIDDSEGSTSSFLKPGLVDSIPGLVKVVVYNFFSLVYDLLVEMFERDEDKVVAKKT